MYKVITYDKSRNELGASKAMTYAEALIVWERKNSGTENIVSIRPVSRED